MNKAILLFIGIIIFCTSLSGQGSYVVNGLVVDENNKPMAGAIINLQPGNKSFLTDVNGNFTISLLAQTQLTIKISFLGYQNHEETFFINNNKSIKAQLKVNNLNLQEVIVTDNYVETRNREESLNIEIVSADYLKQNLGGSIMKSLERLPGVSTIDIGSGQSKPVIRGMGFNRVVVVENGIKHESQQWGTDHGLEIDQYAIDNVEVIKGPASLIYGSDAIGGVIDMKNRKIPGVNSIKGNIDISGNTNNDLIGSSIYLAARKNWFYAGIRATILEYGDYKVPVDSVNIYSYRAALHNNHLRNTAGNEQNIHLTFGIIKSEFQSRFFISTLNSKGGFFANAHGIEPRRVDTNLHDKSNRDINYPYQDVNHFKIINSTNYTNDKIALETDLGFQRNFRQEWSQYVNHGHMPQVFNDNMSYDADLEREFEKYVYSANAKISSQINSKTNLSLGFNSDYQDNRINGRGFIIPAYNQIVVGAYIFAKHSFTNSSIIQAGVRHDYGHIAINEYHDWFTSPVIVNIDTTYQYLKRADMLKRSFDNVSWSVGYNHNLENWAFKTNIGKSFRMPIAKELGANGVNYHQFSYEVGDSNLSPEVSYQWDLGVEFSSQKIAIGTTPFVNYFTNYIYLNPSAHHDMLYGFGNQKYYYTQSEVLRYGFEIHAHYKLHKHFQFGVITEYVYSEQRSGEKVGFTLPFSPPASAIISAKYHRQKLSFIETPYMLADFKLTATQNNIVPPEQITTGSQIVNLRWGGSVRLLNQKADVSMQVLNLFNTKHFNHTSYYRRINVPEHGRSFIINMSIPFSANAFN